MKVLLDVKDDKAGFILNLLSHFGFVKARTLTPGDAEILESIQSSVAEINRVKKGEGQTQPLQDFLHELPR
jgi:hypothetical protein